MSFTFADLKDLFGDGKLGYFEYAKETTVSPLPFFSIKAIRVLGREGSKNKKKRETNLTNSHPDVIGGSRCFL